MIVLFSSDQDTPNLIKTLDKGGFKVDLLVSETAKSSGRGLKITENLATSFAKQNHIELLSPEKLDDEFILKLKDIIDQKNITLGLVFSYGKIIPESVIGLFKDGIVNIHPSLLPKYRGSTPLQSALLNGDRETGYSIMLIDRGCDSGDILYQEKTTILEDDNYQSLKDKVLQKAFNILPKILGDYLKGKITPKKQDGSKASYTKKITKQDGLIFKKDDAQSAFAKIRAYSNWPKAYLVLDSRRVILHEAKFKDNRLQITKIQVEGKRTISFDDFKRGYPQLLTLLPDFVII